MLAMFFWIWHHVDWLIDASILEKGTVFIFRTEVLPSTLKVEIVLFSEMLASASQPTRCQNANIINTIYLVMYIY